eukprot:gene11489-15388_t
MNSMFNFFLICACITVTVGLEWKSLFSSVIASQQEVKNEKQSYQFAHQSINESQIIDSSLYSRQMLVYGQSAQIRLRDAHVIVLGNGAIANEIIKNLVLTGVGKLSIVGFVASSDSTPSLLGLLPNSVTYAQSLNSQLQVSSISEDELLHYLSTIDSNNHGKIVIITTRQSFTKVKLWNGICRKSKVPLISCNINNNMGYIFNDFLYGFEVFDVEGESYKEIPLMENIDIIDAVAISNSTDGLYVRISSIAEESLGFGLEDSIEIIDPTIVSNTKKIINGTVVKVINTQTCIISLQSSHEVEDAIRIVKSGKASVKKVKQSVILHHKPLLSQLLNPTFNPCNGCLAPKKDYAWSMTLLATMKVIDSMQQYMSADSIYNLDSETFLRNGIIEELKTMGINDPLISIKKGGKIGEDYINQIIKKISVTNYHHLCPATVSVLGSVTAQEAIKAITQTHMPISQFFMFESFDSLPKHHNNSVENHLVDENNHKIIDPKNHNIDFMSNIYGNELANKLASLKVFIIGAGAIGSELLKNFALLGIGTGINKVESHNEVNRINGKDDNHQNMWLSHNLSTGGIIVTDMDHIERSNLNRQLLFRENHIGQAKAIIAAEQIKHINPNINIVGLTNKLGVETEVLFNEQFWRNADIIVTALDNVEARMYVDEQCLKYGKWMIDSGTLGTKGNTQVIIPHLTESYSSSADPPESAIPLCTLKSFPYQPEHCIAWAKNKFESFFNSDVSRLKDYINRLEISKSSISDWLDDQTEEDLRALEKTLSLFPMSKEVVIKWAIDSFNELFYDDINRLLYENPLDKKDEDGMPFWGGSRRVPIPIKFDPSSIEHEEYILQSAVLRGRVFGYNYDMNALRQSYHQLKTMIHMNQLIHHSDSNINGKDSIINRIKNINNNLNLQIINNNINNKLSEWLRISSFQMEEFEKDDLSLGHVYFVASAAKLRCRIYSIKELDLLGVQKVAGNIIPALATTTSVIGGLVSLEIIKIASEILSEQNNNNNNNNKESLSNTKKGFFHKLMNKWTKKSEKSHPNKLSSQMIRQRNIIEKEMILNRFRNSFVNLARPIIAFAQPVEVNSYEINGQSFTMWDFIE